MELQRRTPMTMTMNWLIYRLLLFWVLFAGSVIVPSTTWGYDGQIRQSIGYDEVSFSVFDYDSSVAPTNDEKENRTLTTGGAVAYFAGFLALKAAETTAGQTYQIMDGVRRSAAADLTGATTIQAEILDANMVSQGIRQVPINSLLSPKEFIDLSGSGAYRWSRVLEGTRTVAPLPPIQITPGSIGTPIRNVTIGQP